MRHPHTSKRGKPCHDTCIACKEGTAQTTQRSQGITRHLQTYRPRTPTTPLGTENFSFKLYDTLPSYRHLVLQDTFEAQYAFPRGVSYLYVEPNGGTVTLKAEQHADTPFLKIVNVTPDTPYRVIKDGHTIAAGNERPYRQDSGRGEQQRQLRWRGHDTCRRHAAPVPGRPDVQGPPWRRWYSMICTGESSVLTHRKTRFIRSTCMCASQSREWSA